MASTPRQLNLKFTLGTLKHLGGQMYGGGIVKPVAELIANAWDAEATRVEVILPADGAWNVAVADNGHGMTFEQCRDMYLAIGADRRQMLGTDLTKTGLRKVMGRKGLGKLAVIQATSKVEVDTVAKLDDGQLWRTRFRIPYGQFMTLPTTVTEVQPVEMLDDARPPTTLRFPGDSPTGTRTTLLDVRLPAAPNLDSFIRSMHTRFALAAETDDFVITVEGKRIPTIEEAVQALEFEYYWSGADDVEGVGEVRWWIGTTRDPQPRDELQGFALYARKRLAVERPFWFNLTKGFTGQLSKEYMTGAVYVDAVDETEDLIATDRGTINWSHDIGRALEAWGQRLVRTHSKLWEESRGERKLEELAPDARLMDLIDKLGGRARDDCRLVLRSLARQPHATKADLDRTATVLLNGQQHREFLEILEELTKTNVGELPGILARWNVLEALLYLPVVRSRIEVIAKLGRLIDDAAPEFPDIFDHLKQSPELLRPEWEPLSWNKWMATIVKDVFDGGLGADDPDRQKRPDVLCLSDSKNFVVVELKRPGHRVTVAEAQRMLKYMRMIQEQLERNTPLRGAKVTGIMICDELDPDAEYQFTLISSVEVKGWRQFLEDAQRAYGYILDRIVERVPPEDPRAQPYLQEVLVAPNQPALLDVSETSDQNSG